MKNILLCLIFALSIQSTPAQVKARRIEVLFLGDNGHHKPQERYAQIAAALGAKGINFSYTDNLADINDQNLALYDAVLVYANHDNISKGAERSLLNFVASGKGIVPVHCASYCFRNSPEYVKMVGGQFWRHTMDTVKSVAVQPYHPVLRGVGQISTWDETYLHSQLQADNSVIQVRQIGPDQTKDKPGEKTEPYTWTRKYGLGNVFYTAYGHDENTWGDAKFQQLIYNGIMYVVKDEVVQAQKALSPKPFEYKDAKLPNYEKREGPQLQQLALSPEESMKHIQIPADFNLSLFAAEPNVQHPIAMAWDERGRLYVLITKDYPNERKDTGGTDFILICEDTDGDGKADTFKKFADDLSIPTGLVFADGGIVVSQAPHMMYLKDSDGDDKADIKKILFSGFGTNDTHAGPSNLHYGFDNWIWGCVGYSGYNGKTAVNGDSLRFGQAFFRFKTGINNPDGFKIEWMTSTSNNTWGMAFNEAGDVFGSTANNSHGWYMAIPHSQFLNPGFNTNNGSRSTDTHKDMKTITPKVRQVDVFGGFTAASGHNFYTARAFPKHYWNQIAFVAEPTGHVLHQNRMVKNGTNYDDKEAFNLMAGADEWFSPVFAEVGPDGAVWVADWYSFIIQHNPRPDGFNMGKGNAYETDLRDYTHGRIYRVGYNKAPEYKPISLSMQDAQGLLAALKSTNMFWRMHAQRLLVERGKADVVPQLLALVANNEVDELGLNTAAIHALWVLQGLGEIEKNATVQQAVFASLKHPSWAVRKNALQVLPNSQEAARKILADNLLNDTEPLVKLNALLKLNQCPPSAVIDQAVLSNIDQSADANDRWLPEAYATALTANKSRLLDKYLQKIAQAKPASPAKNNTTAHNHSKMMAASSPAMATTNSAAKPQEQAKRGIDLVVKAIKFENDKPAVRENTRYSIEVANQGLDSLKKGQTVYLKIDLSGNELKSTIVSHVYSGGIGPGQTVSITRNTNGPWTGDLSFNSDKAGEYTFNVAVDYLNKVLENNELNNKFTGKLTVSQPPSLSLIALEKAIKAYSSAHPADSVISKFARYSQLPAEAQNVLLRGMATGWNFRRKSLASPANTQLLASMAGNFSGPNLSLFNRLRSAWTGQDFSEKVNPNALVINIKTIPEAMKFDLKEFTAKAGQELIINIENPDAMQHNLVISKPNSLQIVGKAADKMITDPKAAEKNYVPAIAQVIAASPLINPGASYQLRLTVPSQPGNYPFVCTFPGHWSIMNGIMKVVK